MGDPVWFVITRRNGSLSPALIYDRLPPALAGKHAAANGLVDAVRLDTRADAADWLGQPVDALFTRWLWERAPREPADPGRLVGADRLSP